MGLCVETPRTGRKKGIKERELRDEDDAGGRKGRRIEKKRKGRVERKEGKEMQEEMKKRTLNE